MHKLIDYICDELDELERKADKGKLSAAEVQYGDMLAHFKKNLLKAEEMSDYSNNSGYSRRTRYDNGSSYARRRDSRGRYSRGYSMATEEMTAELRDMMKDAPDDRTRMEFQRFIEKIENM